MTPADLQTVIDQALRALPPPRAPDTLLPRVLAAVQQQPLRPSYAHGWLTWPRGWQVAAMAALMLLASAGVMVLPSAYDTLVGTVSAFAGHPARQLAVVLEHVTIAADVGGVLWRSLLEPVVPYLVALVLLMCFACAVFGMALNHLVLGRMLER